MLDPTFGNDIPPAIGLDGNDTDGVRFPTAGKEAELDAAGPVHGVVSVGPLLWPVQGSVSVGPLLWPDHGIVSVGPLVYEPAPFEAAGPAHGTVSVGPRLFILAETDGGGPPHGLVCVGSRPFTRAGDNGRLLGPDHGNVSVGFPPAPKLEGDGPYGLPRYEACVAIGSLDGLEALLERSR